MAMAWPGLMSTPSSVSTNATTVTLLEPQLPADLGWNGHLTPFLQHRKLPAFPMTCQAVGLGKPVNKREFLECVAAGVASSPLRSEITPQNLEIPALRWIRGD